MFDFILAVAIKELKITGSGWEIPLIILLLAYFAGRDLVRRLHPRQYLRFQFFNLIALVSIIAIWMLNTPIVVNSFRQIPLIIGLVAIFSGIILSIIIYRKLDQHV
jgi:hypothetical protein